MMRNLIFLVLLVTSVGGSLGVAMASAAAAQLTGKVAVYSAYFTEEERLRHHRYELWARQETPFGDRFKTVISGRVWWDPVLMDNEYAVHHDYSQQVRDDELYEGQVREAYADYLGDWYRIRVGRQIIDWTESFAPALVNMVTAVDVRQGFNGSPADFIIPVDALVVGHDFVFDGTLEWLVIPRGQPHRLPKGDNGYGYFQFLQREVEPRTLRLSSESIPRDQHEIEGGIRYQSTFNRLDYSLFAYRGHQRDPAFKIDAGLSSVTLTQYHPRVDTYGTSLTYGGDSVVLRGLAFYEPKRRPRDRELLEDNGGAIGEDVYDRRVQFGIGVDYLFSKHLKFYSNHYFARLDTIIPKDSTPEEKNIEGYQDSYFGLFRLTNDSFEDITLKVDGIVTSPNKAYLIEPSVTYRFLANYEAQIGCRIIHSDHSRSVLAPLEESDLAFVRLTSYIDIGRRIARH